MTEPHREITLADVTWLTALARGLVQDGSAADDLVQQTWVAAAESPPRGREVNRAWLSRVLKNLHLKSLRSGQRRFRREQVASKPEAAPSTGELIERAELRRTLVSLLGDEPPFLGEEGPSWLAAGAVDRHEDRALFKSPAGVDRFTSIRAGGRSRRP